MSVHRSLRDAVCGGWLVFCCLFVACFAPVSFAGETRIGSASVSITPDRPVALSGQMMTRVSTGVRSAVTATALALEARDGEKPLDQALLVSCDLVAIDPAILVGVR